MRQRGVFMLFRRDIEPHCAYCERGERVSDTEIRCAKRGGVAPGDSCKAFRYDPLKRIPPRPASLRRKFKPEDFSL